MMGNRLPSKIHPKLRVAVVQAAPEFLDLDGTIDKTIDFMKKAAQEGATLIAFPETWIPGYPWWIWLSSPAAGMPYVQRDHGKSLAGGSPVVGRFARAAAGLGILAGGGFREKAGGSLYIAPAVFSDPRA